MIKRSLRRLAESFARRLFDVWCDPVQAMRLEALGETVEFIKANAREALCLGSREKLLRYALDLAPAEGHVLEFGVDRGASLTLIARALAPRPVYGFDSFEGNPEDWSGWNAPKGVFDRGGRLPRVPENARLVKGWFETTVPQWAAEHPGPIAFLHIDCDLYTSTRTVLTGLAERIVPGTVIVFDEYFNYVNWQAHEHRAFRELVDARGLGFRYVAYGSRQMVVAIGEPRAGAASRPDSGAPG